AEGAAVRDGDGRSYAAPSVRLPSVSVSALQLAVANAVAAGAEALEAAVVVTEGRPDEVSLAAVRDVSSDAPVHVVASDGALKKTLP
ncbi:MAG: cytidine deaminase, partial [Micromonosporaceae bacterium]